MASPSIVFLMRFVHSDEVIVSLCLRRVYR